MFAKILCVVFFAAFVQTLDHQSSLLEAAGGQDGYSYVSVNQQSVGGSRYDEDHYGYPKYHFKYGVEDHQSGDVKQHEETRDGDVVRGSYSVHQPDGTILTVHYTADKYSGYNAVVHREGHAVHPHF